MPLTIQLVRPAAETSSAAFASSLLVFDLPQELPNTQTGLAGLATGLATGG